MSKNNTRLVLVHGLLGSLTFFEPKKYLDGFDLLAPRLHGYGGEPPLQNLSLQDQVDYVHKEIMHTGNNPCWLLGHSVGGAIANIFAANYPELVAGIINVEGNFTLNDAFWCKRIAALTIDEWKAQYRDIAGSPAKWLLDSGIQVTPERQAWAREILVFQDAETVHAMASAVVNETGSTQYEQIVSGLAERDIKYRLVSGDQSRSSWNVPEAYVKRFKEVRMAGLGHMMMLENPAQFCKVVADLCV
jgi:pimeloyl-ACP methyl ester carboxylesterase